MNQDAVLKHIALICTNSSLSYYEQDNEYIVYSSERQLIFTLFFIYIYVQQGEARRRDHIRVLCLQC